jgi:iron-sulfur cluster assembly protein
MKLRICVFIAVPQEGFMSITMDGVELGVSITEKAAEKIKYFAAKDGISENVGLRVAVKGGGCSGLTYDLSITDQELETDKVVEQYGVKVMVDKKSYIFLVGTELDFSDGLNGKGFIFSNPNAKKSCGCGTSFSV